MIRPLPSFVGLLMVSAIAVDMPTASAQFLSERLVPPQQVTVPAVPMVAQPAEARIFGAERPRSHMWSLPFGVFPGTPSVLATEQRPGNWKRPALDLPGLTSEIDPSRPLFPLLPDSARVYLAAANPAQSPPLARFPLLAEPLVPTSEDPGASGAFAILTVAVPLATPTPIPLLRLSIPDPFEQIRTIRLASSPADLDDPATAQDRPPLAKLPMVEAPK